MKFTPILLAVLAAIMHLTTLCAQPFAQRSELEDAKLIITHEPGEEIFLGSMHPSAALFEDYLDINKIVAEHQNYRRELESKGAKVLTVRNILLDGTIDSHGNIIKGEKLEQLRKLAATYLSFKSSENTPAAKASQEEYREYVLQSSTPHDLVKIILLQPEVMLRPTPTNTGVTAEYAMRPVMNLFYMRDQMITTAKGSVLGRMNSPQRETECDIAEFCLEKIGHKAIHRIAGKDAFLEGGDFYPFGNMAFIGCGMRTTQPAIDQLMEHDLLGCDTLVVVRDRRFSQAEMHLDTYFNIIDRDLVTLSTERMTTDPNSDCYLLADIYVRGESGTYHKAESDYLFLDLLTKRLGMEIITIAHDDQQRLANNFLTVGARQIMAVAGQSEALQKQMRDKGVEVTWLPLDNLKKGYGAAHCMTQVLIRK